MKTEETKQFDEEQLIDLDQWRKDKIADALKYQEERQTEHLRPDWAKDKKYFACLATATDPYGEESTAYGNQSFINPKSDEYYEKKGFRVLSDDEPEELGDLYQMIDIVTNLPNHILTLTGKDKNGKNLFTYGGSHLGEGEIVKNAHYPFNEYDKIRRFRFTGRPEDIERIRQHNQDILDKQANAAMEDMKYKSKNKIDTEPISTETFLNSIVMKNRK